MQATFRVIDNDPKGERNGTTFEGTYKGTTVTWTIIEEQHRDYSYLSWLALVEQSKKDMEELFKQKELLLKQTKETSLKGRIKPLPTNVKSLIESILTPYFNSEDKKMLNSVIGKVLSKAKEQSLNVDPFLISEYLKNEYKA